MSKKLKYAFQNKIKNIFTTYHSLEEFTVLITISTNIQCVMENT